MSIANVAAVKSDAGIATSGDDVKIENHLQKAIEYCRRLIYFEDVTDGDETETIYTEYLTDTWPIIQLSAITNNATLSTITLLYSDGTGTTLNTSDFVKIGTNKWRYKTSNNLVTSADITACLECIKVTYTSVYITYALNQLIITITLYEYYRRKENQTNKANYSLGQMNGNYIPVKDFYAEIDRQLSTIWFTGV